MDSQPLFLLDSDVAKKICQYHLLHELANALGCGLEQFAVLPQLKFQLKLAKDDKALAKLGSEEAVALVRQLVAAAAEVEIDAEGANPLLQLNRPDIDSGEATLFAALHSNEESSLVSGDKRAFVALSKVNDMPVLDALWARIICLEEALHFILQSADFQVVSDKIRARPDVDTAVRLCFGGPIASAQGAVIEALQSYMRSLVADTNGKYLIPN